MLGALSPGAALPPTAGLNAAALMLSRGEDAGEPEELYPDELDGAAGGAERPPGGADSTLPSADMP